MCLRSQVILEDKFNYLLFFRDAINPYLLRRMKKDVQMMIQLPEKTEQVN